MATNTARATRGRFNDVAAAVGSLGWSRPLAANLLTYGILTIWALIMLLPIYWMLVTAFKTQIGVEAIPPDFWPNPGTLRNFELLINDGRMFRWLLNSAITSTAITVLVVLSSATAGYAFAKRDFPGRRVLFWLTIATITIPFEVKLLPLFELMVRWGFDDTYFGLILPWLGSPFAIFLIKQGMQTLPSEIIDAARVDGAGEIRVFWQIVLPMSKPVLAVLGIFMFIGSWNAFLWPVVIISTTELRTLPYGLELFATTHNLSKDYGLLMAGAAVAAVPMFAVFFAAQRYFLRGITIGALKG